ncbi:MAG: pantoate--beta-alanine ligase [Myxococcota bacterium]
MRVTHEIHELVAACDAARASGQRVAVVPTMGALHEGHLRLIDAARDHGEFVVVTVFVNPLQFGEGEDLGRYPRTLAADVAASEERGASLVFAPETSAMYPSGYQTSVTVDTLARPLEGHYRPGHFEGVTTVVSKLFNLTQPCSAVFGQKDFQQLQLVRRLARDLDFRVTVVAHPIVREADGLAMSSRNRYLDGDARERAVAIVKGLRATERAWTRGERDADVLLSLAREPVGKAFDRVDYIALADPETFELLDGSLQERTQETALLVAAHLGTTRLIDNLVLQP